MHVLEDVYVCMSVDIYVFTCMWMCMRMSVYVCPFVCICICECVPVCVYVCSGCSDVRSPGPRPCRYLTRQSEKAGFSCLAPSPFCLSMPQLPRVLVGTHSHAGWALSWLSALAQWG